MWRVLVIAAPLSMVWIAGRPQRRADIHRGDLAVGVLVDVGLAGLLVFLGQPRIEHAAEVDVAGVAAGGDDDALDGADVDGPAVRPSPRCRARLPRRRLLADDPRHLVLEQDLRALLARAFGEPPHQPRAVAVAVRRHHLGRDVPFLGDEDARRRSRRRPGRSASR